MRLEMSLWAERVGIFVDARIVHDPPDVGVNDGVLGNAVREVGVLLAETVRGPKRGDGKAAETLPQDCIDVGEQGAVGYGGEFVRRDYRINLMLSLSLHFGIKDHVQEEGGDGGTHGVGPSTVHGYGRVEEDVAALGICGRDVDQSVR